LGEVNSHLKSGHKEEELLRRKRLEIEGALRSCSSASRSSLCPAYDRPPLPSVIGGRHRNSSRLLRELRGAAADGCADDPRPDNCSQWVAQILDMESPALVRTCPKVGHPECWVTGDPRADSRAYKMVKVHTFEATSMKDGKPANTATIVYSADGKTRTVTVHGKTAEGKAVRSTAVYDKE
jgi:hypothetical protein